MFSTLMLAAVSCVVTAVLAYVSVYGFTTGAFAGYTHVWTRVQSGGVDDLRAEIIPLRPYGRVDSDRFGSLRSLARTLRRAWKCKAWFVFL